MIEGSDDIYYGSIGDINSTSTNDIKTLIKNLGGDEKTYYMIENAFAFTASALCPIGKASIAKELTFKSGAQILVREGVSDFTAGKVSDFVYNKTGNRVLSMAAGMASSAGTSKAFDYGDVALGWAKNKVKGGRKVFHNVSELSNKQIEALIKYTGDDYVNINNSLRGMEKIAPENKSTVKAMKSALDNSELPNDMTLFRGTSTDALGPLKNLPVDELVGKKFMEKGFMSTSTSNVVGEEFSGNMFMTIEASKGAKALDISSISQYTTEAEVLFNAGQEMLITSAEIRNGILHIAVIIE